MNWIIARLKEPSTWRGITAITGALGITWFTPDIMDSVSQTISQIIASYMGITGLINLIRKEKKV